MILGRCTEEFQKIYNRYRKYLRDSKKQAFNVEKLLEERSKQMINKQDEEDILYEEALGGLGGYEAGFDDKAIHNRVKFERHLFEGRKKKLLKKSLINKLENDLHFDGFQNEKNTSTIKSECDISYSISPGIIASNKSYLPPINFQLDLKKLNAPKNYENVTRINKIVENNPTLKKNISKAYIEKILPLNKNLPTNSSYVHSDSSFMLIQDSGSSFDHSRLSNVESKVYEEYYKRIQQIAGKKETERLLHVIDKHTKLKSYMDRIDQYEDKVTNAKDKSIKVLDHYEKKKSQLQSKYKRVFEKNFTGF
jgi:hypothetical protein